MLETNPETPRVGPVPPTKNRTKRQQPPSSSG